MYILSLNFCLVERLFNFIFHIILSIQTFRTVAKTIISDTVEYAQPIMIRFLNDLNELFENLMRMSENKVDIAFILKCSDSLKIHSKKIGKTVAFSESFSKTEIFFL